MEKTWVLFLLLFGMTLQQATSGCQDVLESLEQEDSPTLSFLSLADSFLSIEQYQRLMRMIAQNDLRSPLSAVEASQNARMVLFNNVISRYLVYWKEHPDYLDQERILSRGYEVLKKKGMEKINRDKSTIVTKSPFVRMKPVVVPPGSFVRAYQESGKEGVIDLLSGNFYLRDADVDRREVVIGRAFEVMSTPVTYYQWAQVMRIRDQNWLSAIPEHPIDKISIKEAKFFVEKINELSNNGDSRLDKLFEDHQTGDQYALMTSDQMEYLMSIAKTIDGEKLEQIIARQDLKKLREYAWFDDNSNSKTHAVAELKPLFVNGQPIYDLHGNVSSWVLDDISGSSSEMFSVRGGSWRDAGIALMPADRTYVYPGLASDFIGLRIMRISPQ